VTTKRIKDGAVTAPKIAGGVIPSVAFAKVNADGALVAAQSKNVVGTDAAVFTGNPTASDEPFFLVLY
jgi:hypothetical protein